MYHRDDALFDAGYKGEGVKAFSSKHPKFSVIKTHWPFFKIEVDPKTTAVIYIMRSMYKTFLSEFNREYSHSHIQTVSRGVTQKYLPHFFTTRKHSWIRSCRLYAGPYFFNSSQIRHHKNRVSSLLHNQTIWKHDPTRPQLPTLVLFYEDFIADFEGTLRILFEFLKTRLGNAMPSVDDAVKCAIYEKQREKRMYRKRKSPWNPFTDEHGTVHLSLPGFCEAARECWYEHKFGPCMNAVLEVPRRKVASTVVSDKKCDD